MGRAGGGDAGDALCRRHRGDLAQHDRRTRTRSARRTASRQTSGVLGALNFSLPPEQELLREAARDALGRIDTVAGARAALDGAPLPDVWPTACRAGWTGLLVPE